MRCEWKRVEVGPVEILNPKVKIIHTTDRVWHSQEPGRYPLVLESSKSKSTAASRSSSPTKTIADLDLAEPPIRFLEAGGKGDDPPDGALLLHTQFLDLANGFGALPGNLKITLLRRFIVITDRLEFNSVKAVR